MPFPTFFNLPEEKRALILDCAIQEFAYKDYDSASLSQIVARAGIAKGSIYQYFTDKSDLYRYLLELAMQKKAEMLAAAQPAGPDARLFETMRWLFQEMAKFELRYPLLARIGYRATYGKSPLPDEILAQGKQATAKFFQDLVERGKHNGEIKVEVDSASAAFIFSAIFTQLGDFLAARAGITPAEIGREGTYPLHAPQIQESFDQLMAILQFGLSKQPGQPGEEQIR